MTQGASSSSQSAGVVEFLLCAKEHSRTAVLSGAAAAVQARQHNLANVAFEEALGEGEGVIQLGAFLQLLFVKGSLVHQDSGGFAAGGSEVINFISKPGSAADGERSVSFH
jgi:hypothetical protein